MNLGLGLSLPCTLGVIDGNIFPGIRSLSAQLQEAGSTVSLSLNWLAPNGELPLSYQVEYSFNGGLFGNSQTVNHPTTELTLAGLPLGSYQARVRAVYPGGTSSYVVSPSLGESEEGFLIPVFYALGAL